MTIVDHLHFNTGGKMIKEKDLKKLHAETPENERKYRVGNTFSYQGKKLANMLCYVDARYVQDKLDEVVGAGNWGSDFLEIKGNLFCRITITFMRDDNTIGIVSKMDCGTESNVEKQKGEASDAFKRAAVQFGIGRDLYNLDNSKYRAEMTEFNGKWYPPKNWRPE
jgi:hypothetical protein